MNTDSKSQNKSNTNPNPSALNEGNHTLKKSESPQKIKSTTSSKVKQQANATHRQKWISDNAYYKAEEQGFVSGNDVSDWKYAEQEYKEMRVDEFLSNCREDGEMTITGLRRLAKEVGVTGAQRIDSKIKLIHLIQQATQHQPCFMEKPGELCTVQDDCQWRSECQKLVAEWTR